MEATNNTSDITLEPSDAAIILRKDGSEELHVPTGLDDMEIYQDDPAFKAMFWAWVNAEEQGHIKDRFIESLGAGEE